MSTFSERFRADQQPSGRRATCLDDYRAEYPQLCEVLEGRPKEGEAYPVPPVTIMLFLDGGKLKFCLSPKSGSSVAFGTLDDLSKVAEGLERAIAAEDYEWKSRRSGR